MTWTNGTSTKYLLHLRVSHKIVLVAGWLAGWLARAKRDLLIYLWAASCMACDFKFVRDECPNELNAINWVTMPRRGAGHEERKFEFGSIECSGAKELRVNWQKCNCCKCIADHFSLHQYSGRCWHVNFAHFYFFRLPLGAQWAHSLSFTCGQSNRNGKCGCIHAPHTIRFARGWPEAEDSFCTCGCVCAWLRFVRFADVYRRRWEGGGWFEVLNKIVLFHGNRLWTTAAKSE